MIRNEDERDEKFPNDVESIVIEMHASRPYEMGEKDIRKSRSNQC